MVTKDKGAPGPAGCRSFRHTPVGRDSESIDDGMMHDLGFVFIRTLPVLSLLRLCPLLKSAAEMFASRGEKSRFGTDLF